MEATGLFVVKHIIDIRAVGGGGENAPRVTFPTHFGGKSHQLHDPVI